MRHGYSYALVLERVKAKVRQGYGEIEERRHKGVYEDARVQMPRDQWKRKWAGEVRFTFEELDQLADFFGAPNGWPFIDWGHAESLKDAAELLARFAPQATAPPSTATGPETASPSGQPGKQGSRGRK